MSNSLQKKMKIHFIDILSIRGIAKRINKKASTWKDPAIANTVE